jgi:hypothetical protein|tara:strand:- start:2072 stop:2512 length:441 start_codon:yes stop_codon:yes gene_type:complete
MKFINKSNISIEALTHAKQHIKPYNSERLRYIKFGETENQLLDFYGKFSLPKNKKWTIVACVHKDWKYPLKDRIAVASEKIDAKKWKYRFVEHIFQTYDEAILYTFLHEWFHFIKHTKQISTKEFGRQGEPSANKYALHWLKEYGY